jgi:predicted amidohydrolase
MNERPAPPQRPSVRVTIGQLQGSADRPANRQVVSDVFRTAGHVRADLVVLPEYASAFDPHGVGVAHAEPLDGPFVTHLRARAAETGVAAIAGVTLPGRDDRAVNAVVAVDASGALSGVYRKVHLYDAFGQRESDRLEPGDAAAAPLVLDVAGLRFGVMTCYDLRFPESARRLVDAGHWRALAVARAIENTAAVVAVGMAGAGVVGRSLVIGPDGAVGLELDEKPAVRTVDIDGTRLADVRATNPSLANRRYTTVPLA